MKASKAKPRTVKQRRAVARLNERREVRDHLKDLARLIEVAVPEGYRADASNALCCILHNGWRFVLACAKAGIVRSTPYGSLPADYQPFIDREEALFRKYTRADVVKDWDTPKYPDLLEDKNGRAQ
jgi:hypothetical protein